jgi:hypothetical protein
MNDLYECTYNSSTIYKNNATCHIIFKKNVHTYNDHLLEKRKEYIKLILNKTFKSIIYVNTFDDLNIYRVSTVV